MVYKLYWLLYTWRFHLTNEKFLDSNFVPNDWQVANVTPVSKRGIGACLAIIGRIVKDMLSIKVEPEDMPTREERRIIQEEFTKCSENKEEEMIENVEVGEALGCSDHYCITWSLVIVRGTERKSRSTGINDGTLQATVQMEDDDDLRENSENGIAVVIKMKDSDHADEGSILDEHAPIIRKVVKPDKNEPWFGPDIVQSKKLRRKFERQWQKSGLTVHREMFKEQCKQKKGTGPKKKDAAEARAKCIEKGVHVINSTVTTLSDFPETVHSEIDSNRNVARISALQTVEASTTENVVDSVTGKLSHWALDHLLRDPDPIFGTINCVSGT
ncbi:hypothetical protein HOLleu_06967 [Holothuria leucospilota]|uniref:Uncharacterized protein n=1 Tax=Holothuria leucospilota TaxID=206669 RepID=A0A9Q1CMA9_HOLLE|nr:hypothetical protein HOLleu_06967 [Holothuria leucospilota]